MHKEAIPQSNTKSIGLHRPVGLPAFPASFDGKGWGREGGTQNGGASYARYISSNYHGGDYGMAEVIDLLVNPRSILLEDGRATSSELDKAGESGEVLIRCFEPSNHKNGDRNPSLSFNVKKGLYRCNVCSVKGDMVDYLERYKGISKREAIETVRGSNGGSTSNGVAPRAERRRVKREQQESITDDGMRRYFHEELPTKHEGHWIYRNPDGTVAFHIYRYPYIEAWGKKSDNKAFILREYEHTDGRKGYLNKRPSGPFPLLNIVEITGRPDAPVIIYEGETCVDVGTEVFPGFVSSTWMGGTGNVLKSDFSILKDRTVTLVSDGDVTGRDAMQKVASIISPYAKEIRIVSMEGEDGRDIVDVFKEEGKEAALKLLDDAKVHKKKAREWRECFDKHVLGELLEQTGVDLRWNELGGIPEVKESDNDEWSAISSIQSDALRALLADMFSTGSERHRRPMRPSDSEWRVVRNSYLYEHSADPVIEYFESLPDWDGEKRLSRIHTDCFLLPQNDYQAEAFSLMYRGLVWRQFHPGEKFDYAMILAGRQGLGKSTHVYEITGGRWFTESVALEESPREVARSLLGSIIGEVAEFSHSSKMLIKKVKSMISTKVDKFRRHHVDHPEEFPRRIVLFCTANKSVHGVVPPDESGYRRWLTIDCDSIDINHPDFPGLDNMPKHISAWMNHNRSQLFAEAIWQYREGKDKYPLFLEPRLARMQTIEAKKQIYDEAPEIKSTIEEYIEELREKHAVTDGSKSFKFTIKDIYRLEDYKDIKQLPRGPGGAPKPIDYAKVGSDLSHMGYHCITLKGTRYWM